VGSVTISYPPTHPTVSLYSSASLSLMQTFHGFFFFPKYESLSCFAF
jgi:hypothetical protein